MNTLGVGVVILLTTTQFFLHNEIDFFTAASSYYMVALLLYPVATLVTEFRWTRFKSLVVASVFVGIGIICFLVLLVSDALQTNFGPEDQSPYLFLIPVLFVVRGLALFQSNILQYGTDQLARRSLVVLRPSTIGHAI